MVFRKSAACVVVVGWLAAAGMAASAGDAPRPVGVVSHVKVLSDKVEDVSSLDASLINYFPKPSETYTITCAAKPTMKSLVVELAE